MCCHVQDIALHLCRCLEPSEEIDVINVAFELRNVPTQSPGRYRLYSN